MNGRICLVLIYLLKCLEASSKVSEEYSIRQVPIRVGPGEFLVGWKKGIEREDRFCQLKDTNSAVLCPYRPIYEGRVFHNYCCVSDDVRGSW